MLVQLAAFPLLTGTVQPLSFLCRAVETLHGGRFTVSEIRVLACL